MSQELVSKQDGPALRITINRPEAGNGMSDDMARELTALLEAAHQTAQFVVLKAAGKDFCIGRASMGAAAIWPPRLLPAPKRWSAATRARWCSIATAHSAVAPCR